MKCRHIRSLVYVGSAIVLPLMTGRAQSPSATAVASAMRCPAYPDTQFLDPEKYDFNILAPGCLSPSETAGTTRSSGGTPAA